ncbi:Fic/DOC family N-terminal domain-containing protein [Caldimonas mangrovi]
MPPGGELESRAVLKACIEARAALAELKQAAERIPNQAMLINTLPLLEAKDSVKCHSARRSFSFIPS